LSDQPVKQPSRLDELAVERNVLAVERNDLAIGRNELANERTVLAYARTSIMAFLTGVTLFKLFPESETMKVLGWISIVLSAVLLVVGSVSFVHRFRSLLRASKKRKEYPS
jgi:putative membrane protein